MQSLLRKTFAAGREIKTREKLARIGDSAWGRFGVKVRCHTDAVGGGFDQVAELSSANLPALVRSDEKRFVLPHAPLAFPVAAAFHSAPIQNLVSPIELVDLLVPDETKFFIQRRPFLFVETGENKVRPDLALGLHIGKQVHTAVGV